MAEVKREDVLAYLENANMLEISELIKEIEDKFGVTAAAPVAIAGGAAPAAGDAAGAAEEKSEFDVELTGVGDKKINVIKVIRTITSLGLKEAKDLADNAPSMVKETVPKEEAEEIKKQLEEAGATVTLK
ncbi:MAG: 50S ribosomal protein L7/L12 [Candidatus Marinimicrobia bacterium]|jgi:large subunit ribosomal protein L7/L12|nr:50S ribosomal protein L7/L12 [Candidatus Neomarinimicrobiota bacterium]MDP6853693.1 50S ribosomal protein L7/L12 [Candidatus Neomarinimicrobiota bacterium]MDP6936289.1 50S ribosomal protein L7/L12 [Candidatus Neomarinimicrobiota bacterium]